MRTVIITLLLSLCLLAPAAAQNPVTVQQFGGSVDTNSGNKSANTQRVVIATDQPTNSNAWLVSGTVTANQGGTWTVQPGNTANTTAWKVDGSAVTQPVSGTFWQATQPVSGTFFQATQPVSGTVTANQGGAPWTANITQFGSSNVVTGVGASGSGIPRVTPSAEDTTTSLASVSGTTTLVLALAGKSGASAEIQAGTLVATMSFQSSFDGGVTYSTGFAVVAGVQSITSTAFTNPNARTTVDWILSEGVTHVRVNITAYTSGTAAIRLNATNVVSPVAVGALDTGLVGSAFPFFTKALGMKATTTTPTAATAGNTVALASDLYGVPYVRVDHPARFKCSLTTTATASTVVTGCTAPAAGLSLYITDISVYGGVALAVTAAATIQSGTGGTCGTPVVLYYCQHAATAGCEAHFLTPLRAGTISEVCLLDATVGTKFATVSGYTAP